MLAIFLPQAIIKSNFFIVWCIGSLCTYLCVWLCGPPHFLTQISPTFFEVSFWNSFKCPVHYVLKYFILLTCRFFFFLFGIGLTCMWSLFSFKHIMGSLLWLPQCYPTPEHIHHFYLFAFHFEYILFRSPFYWCPPYLLNPSKGDFFLAFDAFYAYISLSTGASSFSIDRIYPCIVSLWFFTLNTSFVENAKKEQIAFYLEMSMNLLCIMRKSSFLARTRGGFHFIFRIISTWSPKLFSVMPWLWHKRSSYFCASQWSSHIFFLVCMYLEHRESSVQCLPPCTVSYLVHCAYPERCLNLFIAMKEFHRLVLTHWVKVYCLIVSGKANLRLL